VIEPAPSNGYWQLKANGEAIWIRNTALLCWPVVWAHKVNVEGPHVTAFYFDDLTGIDKDDLIDAVRDGYGVSRDTIGLKVLEAAAFGPEEDVPVLRVDLGMTLGPAHRNLGKYLDNAGFNYDKRWEYNAHTTVDLKTALNPPAKILATGLELWWKQDEAVII
jgi:hypothetical protein